MAELIKEDDDDKKEEIVIIEDEKKVDPTEATGVEDDSKTQTENDDEVDDEDEKEREAIRERRRAEKQERKHRREDAMKRDKTELDFLRSRNDDLERRLSTQEQRAHQSDLNGFDAQIRSANQEVALAEKVIAKAVEAGNGEDVTQAMRYRDQSMQRAQQLAWQKQQAAQQKPQQNQIDDITMSHAKEFLEENSWYDSQGRDEESAIVLAVDQAMAKEGFDPRTEDYWIELRRRAAKRLPDRFERNTTQKREARGGPAVGSGREHAPASTRREIYLSPDRKEALVDAGVWDDPILRMKYVKRYAEYDRQNKK